VAHHVGEPREAERRLHAADVIAAADIHHLRDDALRRGRRVLDGRLPDVFAGKLGDELVFETSVTDGADIEIDRNHVRSGAIANLTCFAS
jgi:Holliday junction resolvase